MIWWTGFGSRLGRGSRSGAAMSQSTFSPSWYRVAQLRPQIRSHARLHRHVYRGQRWYVLHNSTTGRCHRLSPVAHLLIGLMNGERTTQELWDAAIDQLGDDGPTQDETIRLLGLLYRADALRCDVPTDTAEMLLRTQRHEMEESWRRFLRPLSLRVPLFDPDALLERIMPALRPLFSWAGALAWCAVVAAAVLVAGLHWNELAADLDSEVLLSGGNLLLLLAVYPAVKALHELGHGAAAKFWGAEVHETGIMFLVFMPVPYVDASGSAVFPDKRRRVLVGAAGILVELLLASLALFVWVLVEPGWIRAAAYDVIGICGVSTLLFNGNPLLRFDGYYVLSDTIEIPNLSSRANQYLGYLLQRHVLGIENVRCPVKAPGEAAWFVAYGVAAFVYRIVIGLTIAFYVASRFFIVGVLLALVSLTFQFVLPLLRALGLLFSQSRFGEKRLRALAISAGLAVVPAALLLLVPVPHHTTAEGVVWMPEDGQVRAGADAVVSELLVAPNSRVEQGDRLIVTSEPLLASRVAVLEAERRALLARRNAEESTDLMRAQITGEELASIEASLVRARERERDAVIRSPASGTLVLPRASDLVGRFVHQGDIVGYVLGAVARTARVVLPQADVSLVRQHTKAVEVRLASRVGDVQSVRIERLVPAATHRLPSPVLSAQGGGKWTVDPKDPEGLRTLTPVFQIDISLPAAWHRAATGERVYVRFDHGAQPLARRIFRGVRRLFLSRLGV